MAATDSSSPKHPGSAEGNPHDQQNQSHASEPLPVTADLTQDPEWLNGILSSLREIVWSLSPGERQSLYLSPAAERIYGRRMEEFTANPLLWFEAIHPADKPVIDRATAILEEFGAAEYEYRIVRPDGTIRWIRDRCWRRIGPGGKTIRVDGIMSDITEAHLAEEAFRRQDKRLASVLQALPDTVFEVDRMGLFVDYHPGGMCPIRFEREQVIGNALWDIFPGDVADELMRQLPVAEMAGRTLMHEFWISGPEGDRIDYEVRLCATALGNFVLVVRDVTAVKRAQSELVSAKDAAEAAARAKSEFLAVMSHEIRTPMNAVMGFTNLLLDSELSETQRDWVDTIRGSSEALLGLLNDILDFSKAESGHLSLERVPFDLIRCIEDVMDLTLEPASRKGIDLYMHLDERVPEYLVGDPGRLRQVLVNLIGNAVKFTERGHVRVHIERIESIAPASGSPFTDSTGPVRLRIAIEDTGIGIEANALKRIFLPFAQADSSTTRRFGGTGLGLAICRRLVEAMDGTIDIASTPCEGTRVIVELAMPEAGAMPMPDREESLRLTELLQGVPVHVVTERSPLRDAIESSLRRHGAVPIGRDTLDKCAGMSPPVVVLDAAEGTPERLLELFARQQARRERTVVILPPGTGDDGRARWRQHAAAVLVRPVHRMSFLRGLVKASELVDEEGTDPRRSNSGVHRLPVVGPLRVLVAEDNPVNQRVMQLTLSKLGMHPDVVANGLEAVAATQRQLYDLILMDVQMPDLDGRAATLRIREQEQGLRRNYIVALTADAMAGDRERCIEAGMDDYLTKPLRMEELQRVLDEARRLRGRPVTP